MKARDVTDDRNFTGGLQKREGEVRSGYRQKQVTLRTGEEDGNVM